jgi:uncharacterized membrane protein
MSNIKDWLTTIAGIALVVFTAIQQYINSLAVDGTIDYFKLIAAIVVAVVAFFTGRNANGSSKKNVEPV